jgi:hypothetical protein
MAKQVHLSLDEIEEYFESLEDPRSEINQKHPFVSVIVIAVMAVLAGAGGPTAIAAWASDKVTFLCQHLALPNGAPKKDVFLRVLSALRPEAFQACFFAWLESLRARVEEQADVTQPILNVDGKTLRRSHDRKNGLGALHSVSVWAADFGMTLAQTACEEKSDKQRGQDSLFSVGSPFVGGTGRIWGRPRGRNVDSRPSRSTIDSTHIASPWGAPR